MADVPVGVPVTVPDDAEAEAEADTDAWRGWLRILDSADRCGMCE